MRGSDADDRMPVGGSPRARGRDKRLRIPLTAVAILAATVAVAACGSSSNSTSTSAPASSTTTSSNQSSTSGATYGLNIPNVSNATLEKTIQESLGVAVPASQFPAVVSDAWKMASEPVTAAQAAVVEKCLKVTVCQTGVKGGTTIADLDDNGTVNPARLILRATIDLQAVRSGKVSTLIFNDANGSLQTFLSDYRSLISQKVPIIMGAFDFGASMLSLTRQASAAGILVVPISNLIPNATGHGDIAFDVGANLCGYGKDLAQKATLGQTSGTVALYTGPPGNSFGGAWQACAKPIIQKAGMQIFSGNTNWSAQGEVQAAAALAASGKDVKSIVYDYNPDNFFRKFLQLNKEPPTEVGGSAAFSTVPLWQQLRKKYAGYKYYVAPSQSAYPYIAVTGALEKLGGNNNIPVHIVLPNPLVNMTAYLNQYTTSLPATMAFGTLLPNNIAAAALGAAK
jgi:ABC-type sugar transport system substrate-binding protein